MVKAISVLVNHEDKTFTIKKVEVSADFIRKHSYMRSDIAFEGLFNGSNAIYSDSNMYPSRPKITIAGFEISCSGLVIVGLDPDQSLKTVDVSVTKKKLTKSIRFIAAKAA